MSEQWKKRLGISLLFLSLLITAVIMLCVQKAEPYTIKGSERQYSPQETTVFQDGNIRVNEADAEELTMLYGIGETLAVMIIREREQNGPFYYPEDLTDVKGIGPAKLAGFRAMLDMRLTESGDE